MQLLCAPTKNLFYVVFLNECQIILNKTLFMIFKLFITRFCFCCVRSITSTILKTIFSSNLASTTFRLREILPRFKRIPLEIVASYFKCPFLLKKKDCRASRLGLSIRH